MYHYFFRTVAVREEVLGSEGQPDTFEGFERRETMPGLSIHSFTFRN